MDMSSGNYSNVKLFGCDAYVFYQQSKKDPYQTCISLIW
jgi:hypothetical protein